MKYMTIWEMLKNGNAGIEVLHPSMRFFVVLYAFIAISVIVVYMNYVIAGDKPPKFLTWAFISVWAILAVSFFGGML